METNAFRREQVVNSDSLSLVRSLCMALPEVEERLSHGEPAWFVQGKKLFVMYAHQHHDDRIGFWCAAPRGAQEALIASSPTQFFRPPYVGPRGWLGIYLDVPVDWDEVKGLITEAYCTVAPKKLVSLME